MGTVELGLGIVGTSDVSAGPVRVMFGFSSELYRFARLLAGNPPEYPVESVTVVASVIILISTALDAFANEQIEMAVGSRALSKGRAKDLRGEDLRNKWRGIASVGGGNGFDDTARSHFSASTALLNCVTCSFTGSRNFVFQARFQKPKKLRRSNGTDSRIRKMERSLGIARR